MISLDFPKAIHNRSALGLMVKLGYLVLTVGYKDTVFVSYPAVGNLVAITFSINTKLLKMIFHASAGDIWNWDKVHQHQARREKKRAATS